MEAPSYEFTTRWVALATCEEVDEILAHPLDLPRWWPEVYLSAQELEPGEASGLGKIIRLETKGFLPYRLRWSFRVASLNRPHGFSLDAWGDFVGTGVWTFRQEEDTVEIVFDWKIRAEKPLLRRLSWLLRPLFSANHQWAMRKGREALERELARRRAAAGHSR